MENLVKIQTYSTRAEADLNADLLRNSGVKSVVSSDGGGEAYLMAFNGPSQLLVNKDDEQKAREILKLDSN